MKHKCNAVLYTGDLKILTDILQELTDKPELIPVIEGRNKLECYRLISLHKKLKKYHNKLIK